MISYEAINRYGNVVRSFSHLSLAEEYKAWMEGMGSSITIRCTRWVVSYSNPETPTLLRRVG